MSSSVPPSRRPPSYWPPGESHAYALAGDGTRLFYRSKDGDHPPESLRAIFCDGVLCDGFIWKYLWDDLAPLLALTHWHYRGHGRSAQPEDPSRIDIAAHADDLSVIRSQLGDPPSVLIGHSMGCQVALEEAHLRPEGVRGLVLICGSFGKVTQTFRGLPILDLVLPKLLKAVNDHEELARGIWSRIPPEMVVKLALKAGDVDPDKLSPDDLLPYIRHMTHVDLPMFLRMLRAAGDHSAEDYLAKLDVPTLVVAGERDTFTPAFLAESMAAAIPGAELFVVKNGSHVAAIEQPVEVGRRVLEFIRDRVVKPKP